MSRSVHVRVTCSAKSIRRPSAVWPSWQVALLLCVARAANGQPDTTPPASSVLICAAKAGERQVCAADTSGGVTLVTVIGTAVCERGRSWDYDAAGIWVADGCAACSPSGGEAVGVFVLTDCRVPARRHERR